MNESKIKNKFGKFKEKHNISGFSGVDNFESYLKADDLCIWYEDEKGKDVEKYAATKVHDTLMKHLNLARAQIFRPLEKITTRI